MASFPAWMRWGAVVGGLFGVAFGLAVVLFADCTGPHCTQERIVGVTVHGALGGAAGAVLGALARSVAGLLRRL